MLTDEGLVQRGRGRSRGRALPLGLWMRESLRLAFVLEVPTSVALLARPRWPPALLQKGSTKKSGKSKNMRRNSNKPRTAARLTGRRSEASASSIRVGAWI
jgi:hypothetical protein